VSDFYDRLAPFYHLLFPDWDASIARQAQALDSVVRARLGDGPKRVLDVTCGIATQALGLAALGHRVTASDLSPGAVARAREEAARRGLDIPFSVADMRAAHGHHGGGWEVVLSADNALPHLLTDDDIVTALRQFHACLRPGGVCLVSVRDYAAAPRTNDVQPYAIREADGVRFIVLQHRAWEGERYEMTFYIVEDRGADTATTHALRSRYYGVTTDRLLELMRVAGFTHAERLDGVFYQPLLVGYVRRDCGRRRRVTGPTTRRRSSSAAMLSRRSEQTNTTSNESFTSNCRRIGGSLSRVLSGVPDFHPFGSGADSDQGMGKPRLSSTTGSEYGWRRAPRGIRIRGSGSGSSPISSISSLYAALIGFSPSAIARCSVSAVPGGTAAGADQATEPVSVQRGSPAACAVRPCDEWGAASRVSMCSNCG